MKPLASFVCMTYNRPNLLNELLYCFLAQDYENKELIILNDQVNVEYMYDDQRVIIYNIKERFKSLGEKRNFSRNIVNGDFIFITDDDDIYYSNHISRLLEFHLDNPDYDIVCNKYGHMTNNNNYLKNWNINVAFNGACISRNYYKSHQFPPNLSCYEDGNFIENAKILKIEDGITSFHYRWGLNIIHVSGMLGDGVEAYKKNGESNTIYEQKIIKLKPMLSEKIENYYN